MSPGSDVLENHALEVAAGDPVVIKKYVEPVRREINGKLSGIGWLTRCAKFLYGRLWLQL